jgi:putative phosphoribosyl transferase
MADTHEVSIEIQPEKVQLKGILTIPKNALEIVVFAHGSGSGRSSPRNQFVAEYLQKQQLATLLLDLLTVEEEAIDIHTREYRFNIPLLAKRLIGTSQWLAKHPSTKSFRIAYFGASTGAAAALIAAAQEGKKVASVVSRGGRPDLAASALPHVTAPTLLIVGGDDVEVIALNREAYDLLQIEKKLEIVPGATHLFEEHGKLEEVARLAAVWFKQHL